MMLSRRTQQKMTDEERVAKRMFEAHAQTITYGTPWDKAIEPVKKVWLLMAREALDEMKERNTIRKIWRK